MDIASARPQVTGFYDKPTGAIQYVVADPATKRCAIIDPILDFDEKSGATATKNADALLDFIRANGLKLEWILDTHPHADHFSAAHYLKQKTGAPTAIGARDRRRPEPVEGDLQLAGFSRRRLAVGQAVRRGRDLPGRQPSGQGDVLTGTYAGLDQLCDRRRRLRA